MERTAELGGTGERFSRKRYDYSTSMRLEEYMDVMSGVSRLILWFTLESRSLGGPGAEVSLVEFAGLNI